MVTAEMYWLLLSHAEETMLLAKKPNELQQILLDNIKQEGRWI